MYHQLTREQRYAIYLGLQEGKSRKAIARQIKVHPSTVGREIKRNSTRLERYSWRIAQESADVRKERLPGNKRIDSNILKEALHLLQTEDWSPKQISGYLSMKSVQISHETIYKKNKERQEWRTPQPLPAQTEIQASCQGRQENQGTQYPGQDKHTRQAGRSRRQEVRGLGNGSNHRKRSEKCHTDLVRTIKKLSAHGRAATGEESGKGGRHGHKAASPLSEKRTDHHDGQRKRVCLS